MTSRLARPAVLVIAVVLVLVAAGAASGAATAPRYDEQGRLIETPFVPAPDEPQLHEKLAIELALSVPRVEDWVARYPQDGLTKTATYDDEKKEWEVKVWSDRKDAGQIVLAIVDDDGAQVTEAWVGPQVAWTMARGYDGAFGRKINEPWIWWLLSAVFFVGLANFRRPLSLRNLDLLVLLSFSASWWFFNDGRIFTSVPLAYPPLVYLLVRMVWLGTRGRSRAPSTPFWPVWLLVAATFFIGGARIGLNLEASNVIDVGYAGVIGAQRIVSEDQSPYGNFPVRDGAECGEPDRYGDVRDRVQTNGRCETANERGDTYGPISYVAYIPGYLATGWSGKWDELPAAHFTSLLLDGLTLVGLALVGWRFGRGRLAATLTFAWVAYPFTTYVSNSNTNDALIPALLVWGFWLSTSAVARGLFVGLASWAKFAPFLLVPLWASYPDGLKRPRALVLFAGGFVLATLLGFWVLLLEPDPVNAARVFWERTFGWQLGRESPFSVWSWAEYPGYPELNHLQVALKIVLLAGAIALGFFPRRKNELQLAALTAAILIGFEIVLTHWFYLYIPWFTPFVTFALFAPAFREAEQPVEQPRDEPDRPVPELVGARV